jgi:uncharacterized protein with HEPN domain
MDIENSFLLRRQSRADAMRRRDARLSDEITGWAVNALFPIRDVPNLYAKFPWRRIRKTRGVICGTLFVVNCLAIWTFELTWELMWLRESRQRTVRMNGKN